MKALFGALLCCLAPASLSAQTLADAEALHWLGRISQAAHERDYTGIFVYQNGSQVESSRIAHAKTPAGERARLEALDGPRREVIVTPGRTVCITPRRDGVEVQVQKLRRLFPMILPEQPQRVLDAYTVELGAVDRVAGHDCQILELKPRDQFRYGHRLCVEKASGLLLKASKLGPDELPLDQFTFTQIKIGARIDPAALEPELADLESIEQAVARRDAARTGWAATRVPTGFEKVAEMTRAMSGKKAPVTHLIYSDGLAAISVFIEPSAGRSVKGHSRQGVINIYTRPEDGYQVTAVGEVPPAALTRTADSVQLRERP